MRRALAFICVLLSVTLAAASPYSAGHHFSLRRLSNCVLDRFWGPGRNEHPTIKSDIQPATRFGDVVLRFRVSTAEEVIALKESAEILFLDVWEFNEDWVDIRLAKDVVQSLLGLLPASLQNAYAPLMPESALAEIILKPAPPTDKSGFSAALKSSHKDLFFADYQPLSVIEPWMRLLASMFSTHVRLINIGLSYEGREINALRVGVHPKNNDKQSGPRQTILIAGGLHAREWISTSTVTYAAYQLIAQYGKSAWVTRALREFDWIFIPTLNPDGFVYSWETDRLWRKNRQPTPLRFCKGIDLDRSFGFEWDGNATSSNPCSESYAGEEPWQAVETTHFADWARNETENNNVEFLALLDLHSYSQQILYPYSFSCGAAPPTVENLMELGMGLAKAMYVGPHGHTYKTTSACEGNVYPNRGKSKDGSHAMPRIELGGGSALDWFYHDLRVKYAYQVKLRDVGSYGFLLPKDNIVPVGKEVFSAITHLGKYLMGQIGVEVEDDASEDLKRPINQELKKEIDIAREAASTRETDEQPDEAAQDLQQAWRLDLRKLRRR